MTCCYLQRMTMKWILTRATKRPLGDFSKTKKLGSSDMYELNLPKDTWRCPELEIYADTETYYVTHGLKPWEHIGEKDHRALLKPMLVKPLLLVWWYEFERKTVKQVLYLDQDNELEMINQFLSNLSYIYNELKRTPVLYFHNTAYDVPVLANLFKQLDPNFILYFFTIRESKRFTRGCMQSPKYNFYCKFGDTLKYDRTMSIAEAGRMFNVPKLGGFPYGMCDPSLEGENVVFTDVHTGKRGSYPLFKAIEYAEQDVRIMKMLHEWRTELNDDLNKVMIGSWNS